ncbi:MAG: alkyl sulfatase dimerization domain-containing protein [Endozoicomonas sp.]
MKKTLLAAIIATLSLNATASVTWEHYNATPEAASVVELPNGAVANAHAVSQLVQVARMGAETNHEQITDNVWLLGGDAYAPTVIELDKGLIVVSTGEHAEDGSKYREYIRSNISDKPVIAVLYDHNHYVAGTGTLLDGDDAVIVAHPDLNGIIAARSGDGQANAFIDEMQPHMASRALIHYGNHNPASGQDAAASPLKVELGHESAFLPATHTLEHGESITIAGLEIQAFHHITDTQDTLTFYIPEYEMVIDNVVWPASNMYTLRGDAYRDPATWSDALREIRDLDPKYVLTVGGAARSLTGKEHIRDTINAALDARNYTYDQAIRLTNMGVAGDQLKHYMPLPESLTQSLYVNNAYGQFETFPEAFPTQNHGYFSGQPHKLHNLPEPEHAKRLIKLAGGKDAAFKAWDEAMSEGEFLWAKELSSALYFNAPGDEKARQAFADTLRKLGQYSEGSIARNFYIAGAMSLEGNTEVSLAGTQNRDWAMGDTDTAVDYLRTRLNPNKAAGVTGTLIFNIEGERYSLEIRNSVAEFSATPGNDGVELSISKEDFAQYYVGDKKAADIAKGDALELLSVFDGYQNIPMYPTSFDHLN